MEPNQNNKNLPNEHFFESTALDHTLLDIEVVNACGEAMGRPYLTLLMDNHSRRVLATHLSLEQPSSLTILSVLRQCFYHHGKLPKSLFCDSGKEFQSIQLDQILSYFGIIKGVVA